MGIVLLMAGIGLLCVLLFNFAVYALPAYVGLSAFLWAMNSGAGLGSVIAGLMAGAITFLLGQFALASRHAWLRWLVILVFVVPATIAGYSMVEQLGTGAIPSPIWRQVFAMFGALMVGATTLSRLVAALAGFAGARP